MEQAGKRFFSIKGKSLPGLVQSLNGLQQVVPGHGFDQASVEIASPVIAIIVFARITHQGELVSDKSFLNRPHLNTCHHLISKPDPGVVSHNPLIGFKINKQFYCQTQAEGSDNL